MHPDSTMRFLDGKSAEDDSPFLSMADFFSLISMTLIYIAMFFAPTSTLPEDAIPVLLGRVAEPGQEIAANSTYAYITIQSFQDGAQILVTPRGRATVHSLTLAIETTEFETVSSWIEGELLSAETPERVIMRVRADRYEGDIHRIFNSLVAATRQRFPISIVILER